MLKYFTITILLFLNISPPAWAQHNNSQANALQLQGKHLQDKTYRVYAKSDYISQMDSLYTQHISQNDSLVTLSLAINNIEKMQMTVGRQTVEWYAIPGKNYIWHLKNVYHGTGQPQNLQVQFEKEDMLNTAMDGFNYAYQNFIETSFIRLIRRRDKSIYHSFEKDMLKRLSETPFKDSISKNYFSDYITYRLAKLRYTAKIESRQSLIDKLYQNKAVLYNNPAYMDLLKMLFDPNNMRSKHNQQSLDLINLLKSKAPLSVILECTHETLSNNSPALLHDLIFLHSIKSVYKLKILEKSYLQDLIRRFMQQSHHKYAQKAAHNLIRNLNTFTPGRTLTDWEQALGQTPDHKSYLASYMVFYTPYKNITADLEALNTLKEEANIRSICIYVDIWNSKNTMPDMKQQYPNIEWIWFDNKYDLLDTFGVDILPSYYLLDKDKLISAAAPKAQEHSKIKQLLQQYYRSHKPQP